MLGRGLGLQHTKGVKRRSKGNLLTSGYIPKKSDPEVPKDEVPKESTGIKFIEKIKKETSGDRSKDAFLNAEGRGVTYSLHGPDGALIIRGEVGSKKEAREVIEKAKEEYRAKVEQDDLVEKNRENKKKQLIKDHKKLGVDLSSAMIQELDRIPSRRHILDLYLINSEEEESFINQTAYQITHPLSDMIIDLDLSAPQVEELPGGYKMLTYEGERKKCQFSNPDWIVPRKARVMYTVTVVFDKSGKYVTGLACYKLKTPSERTKEFREKLAKEVKSRVKKIMADMFE